MNIGKLLSDNMPTVLTSVSVVGVLSTTILAVKNTPYAYRDILDAKSELGRDITPVETVRLTWKYYVPAAIMGAITISSIIGVNAISTKRQAALAGLYTITDKAFSEYKDKVVEIVGEKKEQEVRDEVAKERMEKDPVTSKEVYITGMGEHLCYDALSGRYFKSDIETIRSAVNDINSQILDDMYASVNDFYRKIGLPETQMGDEAGWTTARKLEIDFASHISANGTPCLSIGYGAEPTREYFKSKNW